MLFKLINNVAFIAICLSFVNAAKQNNSAEFDDKCNDCCLDCPCGRGDPTSLFSDTDTLTSEPVVTNADNFPWDNVRLPSFAHPTRYNMVIHPNLTTLEVKGQVTIEFYVDQDTNFIVFHSQGLTITEKMVQGQKGCQLKISKMLEYPKHQQIYLELEESKFRKKGNYSVHLRFTYLLRHDFNGFHLSSYVNGHGEETYLATTHFEPTYARSAFPCFDEPQFKAKFKISILRNQFHIALFNMPIAKTEDAGFYVGTRLLKDDFQESVAMSTYLVAFVVCDFKSVSQLTRRNVNVSVYAPETILWETTHALETASKTLDFFESFFGYQYPLPKLDIIAMPYSVVIAMENWGLITCQKASIIYDPAETPTAAQEWLAVVVAHELAHQWFGNLVTMNWWNDLWLKEAVTSFLEYKGVSSIWPEWRMMDQFILDKVQPGLDLDALASSYPISVQLDTRDSSEIESIFDIISYNKAASILYMLETFLSEDVLKIGLNDYLSTHAYANADTNDLWSMFTKHVNKSFDVKAIMDTWTHQAGFPLITIKREGTTIVASQKRFLVSPYVNDSSLALPKSPFNYKWYVPLSYYTSKDSRGVQNVWMNMTDVTFEVSNETTYIKCNVNQTGFYRVSYPEDMWSAIIQTLLKDHTRFSPADRANLIDDAFTLCQAGELNAAVPLELSLYLLNERDYVPWATALNYLHSWKKKLIKSAAYKKYIAFFRRLLAPVTRYVGWSDEGSNLKKLLRILVLQSGVNIQLDDVVKPAKSLFDDWMLRGKKLEPNMRNIVYTAGVKYGGLGEWNYCWKTYRKTQLPSEKQKMLQALGASTNPLILQRYLERTLNRNLVRPQDVDTVIASVAENPEGQWLAWSHWRAHWQESQVLSGLETAVTVISDFVTYRDYREVTEYFKEINVESGREKLDESLESIILNIYWVKRNAASIDTWLTNYLSH